jgi:hypothetical protein
MLACNDMKLEPKSLYRAGKKKKRGTLSQLNPISFVIILPNDRVYQTVESDYSAPTATSFAITYSVAV